MHNQSENAIAEKHFLDLQHQLPLLGYRHVISVSACLVLSTGTHI